MKKIVLLGDSIREGYDKYVKLAFDGVASVYYPKENCRFAAYTLRHLYDWKNDMQCGDDVDLVHWNAGLWDNLIMPDGKHHTPIEVYGEYIHRVYDTIKILFPKAKIIFATSTPVREQLFLGLLKRYNADIERYNAKAKQILQGFACEINDLYETVEGCPESFYSDTTHLYTEEGTRLLSNRVIQALEASLDIKAKELNYTELFANPNLIVGL